MRGLPDNNADGAEGTIPYIYLDFRRYFFGVGESSGVVVLECIVSRSV